MKKSTLITTIAMIVVVVVALSTATYAWFSASSIAVANVNMTTQAAADWALVLGNKTDDATVSFAGASSDQIDISDNAFAGLYSPIAAIDTTISKALQAEYKKGATFYTATKSGGKVTQNGNAVPKDPAFIRVVNTAKEDYKHLVLKVVLVLENASASTSSYYAAAATRFAICNDKGLYATNGYQWVEGKTADAQSGAEITSSANSGNVASSGSKLITKTGTSGSEFNYTNPNLKNYFTEITADDPSADEKNMGLTKGNVYVIYEVDFGNVAKNDYVNLAIYTWIDGWTADASAANATFTIRYAFTTGAAI